MNRVAMESWHGDYGADAGGYRVLEFDGKTVGRVDNREVGIELVEYVATLETQLAEDNRAKTENVRTMAPAQALSFYKLNRLNAKIATFTAQFVKDHGMLDKCFYAFRDDSCATCREHSVAWRISRLDELHEAQLAEANRKLEALSRPVSDEEYETHYGHGGEDGRPKLCDRLDVDRIIAARTNQPQTKKETKA